MTDPTSPMPPEQPSAPAQAATPPPVPPQHPAPPAGAAVLVPGAATPTKRSNARAWAVGGIALVIALCCGGTGIAALTDGEMEPAAEASPSPSPSPTTAAPTTAAPTTAAPTTAAATTSAPAPTTPPTPKPKVIKGRGDDVVRIAEMTDLAVVKFSCRCGSNTVLRSDGDGLLVNEIGSYSGKRWINLEDGSLTTQFEVEASGSWTLTIGTIDQMATKAPTGKVSGKGDDVLVLGGDASAAKIVHSKGDANFAVHAYSLDSGEGGLLVNEIGAYSGVRPLQAPALVQITADGNWTITPA